MNKSKYQEALKRLLRNRYNSNIKLVGTDYGLKEVRSITKKGRLKKQEDITLIQALIDKETHLNLPLHHGVYMQCKCEAMNEVHNNYCWNCGQKL